MRRVCRCLNVQDWSGDIRESAGDYVRDMRNETLIHRLKILPCGGKFLIFLASYAVAIDRHVAGGTRGNGLSCLSFFFLFLPKVGETEKYNIRWDYMPSLGCRCSRNSFEGRVMSCKSRKKAYYRRRRQDRGGGHSLGALPPQNCPSCCLPYHQHISKDQGINQDESIFRIKERKEGGGLL